MPSFDTESAPDTPLPLFHDWFAQAAAAGQAEPQTMSLATSDEDGRADVRIVMLHGADAEGWWFATHAGSRKGRQLRTTPYATLGFYWSVQGRQVRVRGAVRAQSGEAGQADLRARSTGALASALVGRQSELLDSYDQLARASEAAWKRAGREPDAQAPSWTLYLLEPDEVEFFQGDIHRRHVRLRYRRSAHQPPIWQKELLWP
ncbi:pyridoxal 5'-phosphate synthase [Streptomyces sp. NA04227]|uniref:pyridoxine/pyridoxamine 5'-phosphate oxidase n=1 Tax=Streptomyces sp. NA04227 TaxID=2742136 RepID=UPI0020CA5377|nr:pyridoxal 5'-phosphate synthase [Streptomyces sp. NA04227]